MDVAIAVGAAGVAATGLCTAPMVSRYLAQGSLARLCTRRGLVVLSYDDGPGEAATPPLLDLLRDHGARATFFALGKQAERHPSILDRAVAEGHEVGTHSYRHVHPWKSLPWDAVRDVTEGFRTLAPWAGRGGLFRPPHGKLTPFTWAAARARGARFAWWTIDSGDTWPRLPDAERMATDIRKSRGGVVLMHDRDRADDRTRYVLDLTERLVRAARDDGLRVVPLGTALKEAGVGGR